MERRAQHKYWKRNVAAYKLVMAVHVVWEGEGCGSVDECIKAVQGREKGGPGRDDGRAVDAQQELRRCPRLRAEARAPSAGPACPSHQSMKIPVIYLEQMCVFERGRV